MYFMLCYFSDFPASFHLRNIFFICVVFAYKSNSAVNYFQLPINFLFRITKFSLNVNMFFSSHVEIRELKCHLATFSNNFLVQFFYFCLFFLGHRYFLKTYCELTPLTNHYPHMTCMILSKVIAMLLLCSVVSRSFNSRIQVIECPGGTRVRPFFSEFSAIDFVNH